MAFLGKAFISRLMFYMPCLISSMWEGEGREKVGRREVERTQGEEGGSKGMVGRGRRERREGGNGGREWRRREEEGGGRVKGWSRRRRERREGEGKDPRGFSLVKSSEGRRKRR
jgi:hypothetical protein